MIETHIGYWLNWIGMGAWLVCFWWMHRISARQDATLAELREQGHRIEQLSRMEHDILKEVHPDIGEIKEAVAEASQDLVDVRRDAIAQSVIAEQIVEQIANIEERVTTAAEDADTRPHKAAG